MIIWVADDGSWGSSAVMIFDAKNWTEKDFDKLDDASDSQRLEVAQSIQKKRG